MKTLGFYARTSRPLRHLALTVSMLVCLGAANSPTVDGKAKPLPRMAIVAKAVHTTLATQKGYEPGDILTRSDVKAVLKRLGKLGWRVADRAEIVAQVPADDDFLVKQLRTKQGRKMMHSAGKHKGGYDRLDRMAGLPAGRGLVQDLVRGQGGHEMIEYLTTSPGGKNLGQMLERTPNGRGFNRPTGKIFTADQLIVRLKKSHDSERGRKTKQARSTR